MKTEVVKLTPRNFKRVLVQASRLLQGGDLVVFPTETVYGLGANVFDEAALKKIFKAKGRPAANPVIVHIARLEELARLAEPPGELERKLMERFWPGPLTIIFKKKSGVSKIVTGGLSTIAVRMPAHKLARQLILRSGVPIAAPSANISGRPSGTLAEHIYKDLGDKVPLIIDAGRPKIGLESTVVKIEDKKIYILRPGAVTKEMLGKFASVVYGRGASLRASPGTRYRHYAPRARVEIFENDKAIRARAQQLKNRKIKILRYKTLQTMSRNLYRDLRDLDKEKVRVALILAPSARGLGAAIMDRLTRAARDTI